MPLTPTDRDLLQRCLNREYGAWNDFVDRFLGLIYHVIHYTAHQRSTPLSPEDVEDIAADILVQVVADNYAVLRNFRGRSSLAAYLTVIARRTCVHELNRRVTVREAHPPERKPLEAADDRVRAHRSLEGLEEVQRLLRRLPAREREVVRLFYLEGRTYEEISTRLHIPVNTIGPILSRARKKLRAASEGNNRPARRAAAAQPPEAIRRPAPAQPPEAIRRPAPPRGAGNQGGERPAPEAGGPEASGGEPERARPDESRPGGAEAGG